MVAVINLKYSKAVVQPLSHRTDSDPMDCSSLMLPLCFSSSVVFLSLCLSPEIFFPAVMAQNTGTGWMSSKRLKEGAPWVT